MYLPARDEMFTAIENQGAFLNGSRISVSSISAISEAIVHIGDFAKGNDSKAIHERVKDISPLAAKALRIRMIGTAATDLAFVACGRADALVNHATTPWDGTFLKLDPTALHLTRRPRPCCNSVGYQRHGVNST
jgi:myo-inositol-1(or 4)-monophosphatase